MIIGQLSTWIGSRVTINMCLLIIDLNIPGFLSYIPFVHRSVGYGCSCGKDFIECGDACYRPVLKWIC